MNLMEINIKKSLLPWKMLMGRIEIAINVILFTISVPPFPWHFIFLLPKHTIFPTVQTQATIWMIFHVKRNWLFVLWFVSIFSFLTISIRFFQHCLTFSFFLSLFSLSLALSVIISSSLHLSRSSTQIAKTCKKSEMKGCSKLPLIETAMTLFFSLSPYDLLLFDSSSSPNMQ